MSGRMGFKLFWKCKIVTTYSYGLVLIGIEMMQFLSQRKRETAHEDKVEIGTIL